MNIHIHSTHLWEELKKLDSISETKIGAVAYISDDIIDFKEGDKLVIDASFESIKGGKTSATVIKKFYDQGAELYSLSGLHAKTIVFDNVVYLGSANISKNSQNWLFEMGMISDDIEAVSNTVKSINLLIKDEKKVIKVDDNFIKNILEIPVEKDFFEVEKKQSLPHEIKSIGWLVGSRAINNYSGQNEEAIEKIIDRFEKNFETVVSTFTLRQKLNKYSDFYENAKVGDVVIFYDRDETETKHPQTVSTAYIREISNDIVKKTGNQMKIFYYTNFNENAVDWYDYEKFATSLNNTSEKVTFTSYMAKQLNDDNLKKIQKIISDLIYKANF